jgi:hypothetical protein
MSHTNRADVLFSQSPPVDASRLSLADLHDPVLVRREWVRIKGLHGRCAGKAFAVRTTVRMMISGMTTGRIAATFGTTKRTVRRWKAHGRVVIADEITLPETFALLGFGLTQMNELIALAFGNMEEKDITPADKCRYMGVIIGCADQKVRIGQMLLSIRNEETFPANHGGVEDPIPLF